MANVLRGKGLTPIGRLDGHSMPHMQLYAVYTDVATALFEGDAVALDTTGAANKESYPTCKAISSANADFLGSVVSLFDSTLRPLLGATRYLAASTAGYALVCDDPFAIYEINVHDAGVPLTNTACGDQADLVFGAGDTTTNMSGHELSETLKGTGQQGMFSILRRAELPNNNWGEANVRVQAYPAEHVFKAARVAI